jgi:hypothetical protein
LQEGVSFGDGEDYTAADYQEMSVKRSQEWCDKYYSEPKVVQPEVTSHPNDVLPSESDTVVEETESKIDRNLMTPKNLERDYWDIVETPVHRVVVEYGNDVDTTEFGSGFPASERGRCINGKINPEKVGEPEPKFGTADFYKETGWNLKNIPCSPDSILRHVRVGINGINVPWLYFGCLFSTFCWHNEDNYLYSINYHHKGAPKQWYGVPGTKKDAAGVEKVFKNYLSMKMRDMPDLLHHITTMFSPRLLQKADVPVYSLLQNPGEFVVTFPRAFHGGFSMGPNVGEAVNFATHDWIAHGADASERYRSFARPAVFSHDRLTFTMANHLKEQKKFETCKLLAAELERVINEELRLRAKLIKSGVRDVSEQIDLPHNRLDQLDEESADYDDKRLCHACKHVCFFSAVACECSQSKVSCLRHSHYMCRCPTERKYLMIWSNDSEMNKTRDEVKRFCEHLEEGLSATTDNVDEKLTDVPVPTSEPIVSSNALDKTDPGPHVKFEDRKDEIVSFGPFFHSAPQSELDGSLPSTEPTTNSAGDPTKSEIHTIPPHVAPVQIRTDDARDTKRIKLDESVSSSKLGPARSKFAWTDDDSVSSEGNISA